MWKLHLKKYRKFTHVEYHRLERCPRGNDKTGICIHRSHPKTLMRIQAPILRDEYKDIKWPWLQKNGVIKIPSPTSFWKEFVDHVKLCAPNAVRSARNIFKCKDENAEMKELHACWAVAVLAGIRNQNNNFAGKLMSICMKSGLLKPRGFTIPNALPILHCHRTATDTIFYLPKNTGHSTARKISIRGLLGCRFGFHLSISVRNTMKMRIL